MCLRIEILYKGIIMYQYSLLAELTDHIEQLTNFPQYSG